MGFAAPLRDVDLRTEVFLAASRKLAKQLKWAADRKARFALIYGASDKEARVITVRDMDSGEQTPTAISKSAVGDVGAGHGGVTADANRG